MISKPLTMTIVCRDCEFQYGVWRVECPTCGTLNNRRKAAITVVPKERRVAQRALPCTLCRRTVKDGVNRCPQCNELVHTACLPLHAADCSKFQLECQTALARLSGRAL